MTWKPLIEKPIPDTPLTLVTLRSSHSHEAGHELVLADRTLRVLPDGHTTARKRSYTIVEALTAHGQLPDLDLLALVVGSLVLTGANALEVDGASLMTPTAKGEWRVVLNDDGSVQTTWLGETT